MGLNFGSLLVIINDDIRLFSVYGQHNQTGRSIILNHMERDLTSGSVLKSIVYFSLPYFLSYFLQTLYGMADLFVVGQFNGVGSITAVSVGSQAMHMLTVMAVGLAMGATVLIGQATGARQAEEAAETIRQYHYAVPNRVSRSHGALACPCWADCPCHVHACRSGARSQRLPDHLLSGHPVYHSL